MGLTWVLSAPDGPHIGPKKLAIRDEERFYAMASSRGLGNSMEKTSRISPHRSWDQYECVSISRDVSRNDALVRWYKLFPKINFLVHDDVIKWKHFPRNWPFVRGIHRSPVNSLHKDQWRGALMFSWICARINGWVNNGEAGDLRHHRAHYDVILMKLLVIDSFIVNNRYQVAERDSAGVRYFAPW